MASAACVSSPRIRYRRPQSTANSMMPSMTGPNSTSIWRDTAPRVLLFWFLISTWSYKFRLIRTGGLSALFTFLLLLFLHRWQEHLGEIRQLGLLVRRNRLDEVRCDHYQQLIR